MEEAEKERKQKLLFRFVPTRCLIENSKKVTTKFKKLKNTILNSFQAKIRLEKDEKERNKNYRSIPFRAYPIRNRKFQTNSYKIQKIKKYLCGFISCENRQEKAAKERE